MELITASIADAQGNSAVAAGIAVVLCTRLSGGSAWSGYGRGSTADTSKNELVSHPDRHCLEGSKLY